jgi:DNA polymerase-3 subunit epsilon
MGATAWWEQRMAGFDLETTAPDPEEARIVTAAVALCGGGGPTDSRVWLADPGVEIPEEAAAVHGITTERAQADGRDRAEVVREVVEKLTLAAAAGWPLVIFNGRYDLTVMDRECRRLGIPPLSERQITLRVIDPLVIDKWLHRFRPSYPNKLSPERAAELGIPSSRTLDGMCREYGAILDGAHDAAYDAVAACRLAWVLGAKGKVVRNIRTWGGHAGHDTAERRQLEEQWEAVRYDLDLLHAAQIGWAAEQAAGLADYWREKMAKGEEVPGDPDEVRGDWPFVPASSAVVG